MTLNWFSRPFAGMYWHTVVEMELVQFLIPVINRQNTKLVASRRNHRMSTNLDFNYDGFQKLAYSNSFMKFE